MDKKTLKYLSKKQYLRLFPKLRPEKAKNYTTLMLTLIAFSGFSFFAINPTISAILQLKKQIADSELVNQKLDEKTRNLLVLQQKYTTFDQGPIQEAIPQNPNLAEIMGQIQALVQKNNLTISKFQTNQLELVNSTALSQGKNEKDFSSFSFSFDGQGSSPQVFNFVFSLANLSRVITIDSLSLTKASDANNLWQVSIQAKGYFKK